MILINLNNLIFLLKLFFDNDIIHFYLYCKYKCRILSFGHGIFFFLVYEIFEVSHWKVGKGGEIFWDNEPLIGGPNLFMSFYFF